MDGTDLDAAVVAARAGDAEAFGRLWQALAPKVAGYLRSHGVGEPDDVTSEVFLAAFRQVGSLTGEADAFRALLFTIAHRRQVDWHRKRSRRGAEEPWEEAGVDPATPSAEAQALEVLAQERVVALLRRLTADQRAVLALRVVADLSLEQTAAVLRRDVGSVKSLQHRALARLRKEVSPDPYPAAVLARLHPRHA